MAVDAPVQATKSMANRAKEMAATDLRFRITSAALLRYLFDPLKIQGHIAPVLFLPVGKYLLRPVRVFLHGVTRGRQAGPDNQPLA